MTSQAVRKSSSDETPVLQFSPGDFAVYPAYGVGIIESIESREVGGRVQDFYIMKIPENCMVIMIPVHNSSNIGLRKIIEEEDIQKIYDILQGEKDTRIYHRTWKHQHREYTEKLKTGCLYHVAEIFRDMYKARTRKELSFSERKLLDITKGLLLRELSFAQDKHEHEVMSDLEPFFSTQESLSAY